MSAFFFDPRNIIVILTGIAIVLGITMILIRLTRKTYPGFGLWTAGTTAFALSFLLFSLRNIFLDSFTIVLANALILSAALCFWEGTRRFRGKEVRKILFFSIIVFYTVFQSYFTFVNDNISIRIIVISLLLATISALVALELLRNVPRDLRPSYWFTGSLFAFNSIFMLACGFLTELFPSSYDLMEPSLFQTTPFILAILLGIAWTFGFLILNSGRIETELKNAQTQLQEMTATDLLTGIASNRFLFEAGEREFLRARRYQKPLAVLILDIDHLKKINDKYGPAIGDKVLVSVADVCKNGLRNVDIFGRVGGEEFAILLPETDISGGIIIAERLRTIINKNRIKGKNRPFRITVSVGVTDLLADDDQIDAALKRADDAMNEAKRKGRNQVIVAM